MNSPMIKVRIETHYGRTTVYPVCETAKTLARLAGTITLTTKALGLIKDLGFSIEVETPSLDLTMEKK